MAQPVESDRILPDGWHTVTPRIVVRDAKGLVAFLVSVFDAVGDCQDDRPALVSIGDSKLMISEAGQRRPMPTFLHVYVADVDAIWCKALEQGAIAVEHPFDTPYGDRRCMVEDAWGNRWQIAVHLGAG